MNQNGMNDNNLNNTSFNNIDLNDGNTDDSIINKYANDNRVSNEAAKRLQEKRDEVAKSMRFCIIGALFLLIPPIGIALIFFGYMRVSKAQKEMKGLYKDAFVREPLANNFQNVVYQPSNGFNKETVRSFQLCKMGNTFYSEDYIRANYQGVDFEVAQVNVREVDHSDDKTYSKTYFEGRMMVFNFPDKIVSSVLVYSRKFKNRALREKDIKKEKVELEGTQFNKDFDVYSPVPHDVFYLITPQLMERLQFLAGKYDSIAMDVVGNTVILAFNEPGKNPFDQDIAVGKLDYDKEINKVQAEIDDIKTFISMILNLKE